MSDYSLDEKREQRFEKARSFLSYINLSSDEFDPYTVVMNKRFCDAIYACFDYIRDYAREGLGFPADLKTYIPIVKEMKKEIERRFSCLDWSGYISKYGVDARNSSGPAALRNIPGPRNAGNHQSYNSESSSIIASLKKQLEDKENELKNKEKKIKTIMDSYLTMQRQYNELASRKSNGRD